MSRIVSLVFVIAACAWAGEASAQTLTDGDGFVWDVQGDARGDVMNGTTDAYDYWPNLCVTTRLTITPTDGCVAGEIYDAAGVAPTMDASGREIQMTSVTLAGLSVSRRVYVPSASGEGWARYLDVLTNPGSTPVTVRVRVGSINADYADLGSDDGTTVTATSDGSGAIGAGLLWFATDDGGSGDPSLGHVVDGAGGVAVTSMQQDVFGQGVDAIFWEYGDITVPAGGTVMVMYFLTQQSSDAAAAAVALGLTTPSATSLANITDVSQIVNWSFSTCGNGTVESGEQCDDGNTIDTDACTATCQNAVCGDGSIQAGVEACDDGAGNSDSTADACRTDCSPASCGDGVVDTGEMCDDGNTIDTDGCSNTCAPASCGDGVVQAGTEECDDGNTDDTDACTNACTSAVCGDGIVHAGVEACDEGTSNSDTVADACRTTCVAAACGDSVVDMGETCDEGSANGSGAGACLVDCSGIAPADVDAGTDASVADDAGTGGSDAGTGGSDAGTGGGDAGTGGGDGGGLSGSDAGSRSRSGSSGGCGCGVGSSSPRGLAWLSIGLVAMVVLRRRRR